MLPKLPNARVMELKIYYDYCDYAHAACCVSGLVWSLGLLASAAAASCRSSKKYEITFRWLIYRQRQRDCDDEDEDEDVDVHDDDDTTRAYFASQIEYPTKNYVVA